jgi:hypothetical protein
MADFLVCDEGNVSYIPEEQNEKDDIHLQRLTTSVIVPRKLRRGSMDELQ